MRAVAVLCSLLALRAASARVHISAEGDNIYFDHQESEVSSYYGGTVTIFCSGTDATKLTLTSDESEDVQAIETVNTTTVKLTPKDRATGEYKYMCDDETSYSALIVNVYPDITVKSQYALYRMINIVRVFFVPIGEDYEVFCSASAQASLAILKNGEEIETHAVNLTSVKTTKQQDMVNSRLVYSCVDDEAFSIIVYVDEPPAPINFHCVLFEIYQFTCNWNVRTLETTFTLHYSDEFENSMRVCEVSTNRNSISCVFNTLYLMKHGIVFGTTGLFIMESCNMFMCINKTFNVEGVLFWKPEAPSNLTQQAMSASQAVISWTSFRYYNSLDYEATYRTPGTAARELDKSSLQVTCARRDEITAIAYKCEGQFKLPCPRTLYEIKVYVKDSRCPGTTDACWSDPGTIALRTGKRGNSTVDPACDEPIRNKYVAMYKVQEDVISFDENMSAYGKTVKLLQNKLDTIKKLCGELSLDDCRKNALSKTGRK